MRILFIILISMLVSTVKLEAQNLYFIGERSFTCTEGVSLNSNNEKTRDKEDLIVHLAKDSVSAYIIVDLETMSSAEFSGKLIIYLDDGKVITSSNIIENEYVDNNAKAVYVLTNEQVEKLRTSNINTIRYTLKFYGMRDVNHSASNSIGSSEKNFPELVEEFYKEVFIGMERKMEGRN